ncbi:unnamed protein product [Discosporangium mesarthrocarpum]
MESTLPTWALIMVAIVLIVLLTGWKVDDPRQESSSEGSRISKEESHPPQVPQSQEAQKLAKKFGLTRTSAVTLLVNDVVLYRENGQWRLVHSALTALKALCQVCNVYLIARVDNDEEEDNVRDRLRTGGVTVAAAGGGGAGGILEHRLVFCSSMVGLVAIIRQLRPQLHVGGGQTVC